MYICSSDQIFCLLFSRYWTTKNALSREDCSTSRNKKQRGKQRIIIRRRHSKGRRWRKQTIRKREEARQNRGRWRERKKSTIKCGSIAFRFIWITLVVQRFLQRLLRRSLAGTLSLVRKGRRSEVALCSTVPRWDGAKNWVAMCKYDVIVACSYTKNAHLSRRLFIFYTKNAHLSRIQTYWHA